MTLGKLKFVEDDGGEGMEEDQDEEVVEDNKRQGEGEEPPTKRIKKDVTKEAEEKLRTCDKEMAEGTLAEKFDRVSALLEYLYENNINTFEFEEDFTDWMKKTLLNLIDDVPETRVEFYSFLCNVLKVAPTIVEPVCEKVLQVIYLNHVYGVNPECDVAHEMFMEKLAYTFEKLRRFPKLMAKLLCCVRENIGGLKPKKAQKKRKSEVGKEPKEMGLILSKRLMDAYSSILSMLPPPQIVDMWKTLQHNLEEECIKKLKTNEGNNQTVAFLTFVVDLTVAFLYNIKVADYSVPISIIDRMSEIMKKLQADILTELGAIVISFKDAQMTRLFLKLSLAWAHVNQFLVIYNENYKGSLPDQMENCGDVEDLSILLPFLSGDQWTTLLKSVVKNGDAVNAHLGVSLVAVKLKCMAAIDQRRKEVKDESLESKSDEDEMKLSRITQEAAQYVWSHQDKLLGTNDSLLCDSREDILEIASAYMDHEKLIEYAKGWLDNVLHGEKTEKKFSIDNVNFHVALVLEALEVGVNRLAKMNLMKRSMKKFLHECLSCGCKVKILRGLEGKGFPDELKKVIMAGVEIVNESISEGVKKRGSEEAEEHMPDLLKEIIFFLSQQELGQYPSAVRILVFLCLSLIFTAVIGHKEYNEVVEELASLLGECGRNSASGNDLLFHVKWSEFFQLVSENTKCLERKGCEMLCKLVLENVYISPKVAKEFGDENLELIKERFDLGKDSGSGQMSLFVFDFLLKDLSEKGTKSKSSPLILSHLKELGAIAVSSLSDGSISTELRGLIRSLKKMTKRKSGSNTERIGEASTGFVSGVMHACYLLVKGKPNMSPEKEYANLITIVLPYLHFALEFLEVCSNGKMTIDNFDGEMKTSLFYSIEFLIECLKIEEIRDRIEEIESDEEKLAVNFLQRLWDSSCSLLCDDTMTSGRGMLKLILEIAKEEKFQAICDSIIGKVEGEGNLGAKLLSILIETEIGSENERQMRRMTVEKCLYKYLGHLGSWKENDGFVDLAIPYLQFQTALVRRRKPMSNLNALSISLVSVTALPFDKIEDVDEFKRVFSQVCELLNALTVHRLDVLAFRTHIFLQCFQFLVESLVKRADQRNKLTDREIYDLRYCGHCIERICQSAKLGRQEFTRVAPYLVVVLLKQFEKITVYPVVKNPLLNGCYKMLDMCDEKGVAHVNSMLSPGSREIFKAVYDLYKKFYKYKGKV